MKSNKLSSLFLKFFLKLFLALFILILILVVSIQIPFVQNKLVKIATSKLSQSLNTEVKVDKVTINLLTSIQLKGVLIRDLNKDTAIYINSFDNHYSILGPNRFLLNEKKIELQGVRVYLKNQRQDSVLNLVKIFNQNKKQHKPKTTVPSVSKSDTNSGFLSKLKLNEVIIRDFKIQFDRKYKYELLNGSANYIKIDLGGNTLNKDVIPVKSILLEKPFFSFYIFKNNIPPKDKTKPQYLSIPLKLDVSNLKLEEGHFKFRDENGSSVAYPHHIAFSDLDVNKININADSLKTRTGTIQAKVKLFSFKEKSGVFVHNLSANAYFSSYKMIANQLDFKTNHSHFKGNVLFDYNHMMEYLQFAKKIKITATLNKSSFGVEDLGYFVSNIHKFQQNKIHFNSQFKGTLNDLRLTNFDGNANQNIKLKGDINVTSLFPIEKLDINANIKTISGSKKDMEYFLKGLKLPENIGRLGEMQYQGNYKGNFSKFALHGNLKSNIGAVNLKNVKFDFEAPISTYEGSVDVANFELSRFMQSATDISNLSASVDIKGKGFKFEDLNAYMKGRIHTIKFNNYLYNNIVLNGNFIKKQFQGSVSCYDPNLMMTSSGSFSLSESKPELQMFIDLQQINLKKLNFTNKDLIVTSKVNAFFVGKNIDDINGNIQLNDLKILDNTFDKNKEYLFSNLKLTSTIVNDKYRIIDVNSKEIIAKMQGDFKPSELPSLLKDYLINYFDFNDNLQQKPKLSESYFSLNVSLNEIKNYSTLFVNSLKNIEKGTFKADYYGNRNELIVNGELLNTSYSNAFIPSLNIKSTSTLSNFNTYLKLDSIFVDGKLAATPFIATLKDINKGLKLNAELMEKKSSNFVEFNATLIKDEGNYIFKVLPFTSYFNRKTWNVEAANSTTYNPIDKKLTIKDLVFFKDNQKLKINTIQNPEYKNLVSIDFEDILLNELISGFLPNLKGNYGTLEGNLSINNFLDNPSPIANIQVKDLILENTKMGEVKIVSKSVDDKIITDLNLNGDNVSLNIIADYFPNSKVDSFNAYIDLTKLNPKILNGFLKDYVYDMNGNVRADLNCQGTFENPNVVGKIYLDTLYTKVNTIHTAYTFVNQKINLSRNLIEFQDVTLRDEYNNLGKTSGKITHQNLHNFKIDIQATSKRFYCMNTTYVNNNSFYGSVFADISANFTGAINDRITIAAKGQNLEGSNLTIAFNNTQNTEKYYFYEFMDKNSNLKLDPLNAKQKNRKLSGVNLDFNFIINKTGRLSILFDPATQDKVECTGEGKIAFKMSPETDMDIKGTYTLAGGTYLFTFQNFIQRTFYLNPGGEIQFLGDPWQSQIDASATFKARASAQELVEAYYGNTTDQTILAAAKNMVKVNVTLNMKKKLVQPSISYDIDIEQNNPTLQSAFESIKTTTKNNENEMNRQVFGLLALQRFFPPNVTGFEKVGLQDSDFSNTAFDLVTGKVSGYISDWLGKTIQGFNFDFNYRNSSTTSNNSVYNRNELKVAMSQKLFNDRLIFNAGGNYNFGQNASTNSNSAFFGGDFDIEYLILPSGNLRGKFYTTIDNDPLNSKYINKRGAGIIYRKDFDNLLNFLNFRKNKEK